MKVTPKLVRHIIVPIKIRSKHKISEPKLQIIGKKVFKCLSFISTFAVFAGLILFIWGKISNFNISDNDLLMKDVTRQLPSNVKIDRMYFADLFGFGNDSMIVTVGSQAESDTGLLIYDKVNNSFLSQVYNLFGFGSNYKLRYSEIYQNEGDFSTGFNTELVNTVDLTGDNFKEIIERNVNYGGSGGSYSVNIISYSFKKNSYYSLGTFPPFGPYVLKDGKSIFVSAKNNTDDENLLYDIDKFFKGTDNSIYLVRARCEERIGWNEAFYNISVFEPSYNQKDDTLSWRVLFSKDTHDTLDGSTESIIAFLNKNGFDDSLSILSPVNR